MVFSSEIFLFLFLPNFLLIYYLAPVRWRSGVLLAGSYLFYAWWRIDFLGLLVLTTVWTWALGRATRASLRTGNLRRAKTMTAIGVTGCLGVLGVFKYFNFFVDSFAGLFGTTPEAMGVHWQILLPIGISFYVFQSISYLVDTYRGDADEDPSFIDFAAFIALFPQLIAGPILRYKDLADQFRHREHSLDLFTAGMQRFFIGLAKKVLLADAVAPLADLAFQNPDPTAPIAWVGAMAYMLQLYFDFSGYSDMAIGLGMMMGFRFVENFDTPYASRSITEFWKRWHISLSVWLRDYLYIPIGGNRKGAARTYVNLMVVMVLGGLWHGSAWTYVLWGAWHGGWLAAERWTRLARSTGTWALGRTLLIVLLGWVAFRAATLGDAVDMYAGMIGLNGFDIAQDIRFSITREMSAALVLSILVAVLEPKLNKLSFTHFQPQSGGTMTVVNTLVPTLVVTAIAMLAILRLAEQSVSPFLYFQF